MPEGARKASFPSSFLPMLATLTDPFDREGWVYEIKWDGYRAVALINKSKTDLISRNSKSFNDKFYPVFNAVKAWNINAIIDGEIVVLDDHGKPDFSGIQNWRSEADGHLVYYVFDVLWYNGYDLTEVNHTERRKLLATIIPEDDSIIRMSETFDSNVYDLL